MCKCADGDFLRGKVMFSGCRCANVQVCKWGFSSQKSAVWDLKAEECAIPSSGTESNSPSKDRTIIL